MITTRDIWKLPKTRKLVSTINSVPKSIVSKKMIIPRFLNIVFVE